MGQALFASDGITALDQYPVAVPTRAGWGGVDLGGGRYVLEDHTSLGIFDELGWGARLGDVARLARFPVEAMVQSIQIYTDTPLDTAAEPTLALDFNIAFSDANTSGGAYVFGDTFPARGNLFGQSVPDGTKIDLAGLIPTSAQNGNVNNFTNYATSGNPNIEFGTYTVQSGTEGIPLGTDITFGSAATGLQDNDYTLANMQQPMWYVLGFTTGNMYGTSPTGQGAGGFFDLFIYASTAATTPHTSTVNWFTKIEYYLS